MRCSKCVLSDHIPNIIFDAEGVCNYCQTYQPVQRQPEAALRHLLEGFRRDDGGYECMVGLSGGRDSSYALLTLVKDYGMKVLAINYENPFTVPQARANIEKALATLDVELIRFPDRRHAHQKAFTAAVRAWLKHPNPALIPLICIGCKPAWLQIYRLAQQHDIHCIVSGGNPFEVIAFKRELVGISRDEANERAFSKYIYSLRELLRNRAYLRPRLVAAMAKAYLFGNPRAIGLRRYHRHITWVEIFDYLPWDEDVIVARIKDELGWDAPPELASTWRFDCSVHHLIDYLYLQTLGITDNDDFYAKMVREGLVTRAEALDKVQRANRVYRAEIVALLEGVGIDGAAAMAQLEQGRG